jgi:hypothetical protein
MFHLPPSGYEIGANLPGAEDEAKVRWRDMRRVLAGRATTGVVLVLHGADHHALQRDAAQALALLERVGEHDNVRRSSLRAFAERAVARAAQQRLRIVSGELRDSYGYAWTLQGTFGTRAAEKRLNALAERALVRGAEPWVALAARRTPSSTSRALVHTAWRTLLAAHPHDTLCGTAIDEVAAAMELRLVAAANQATGLRDDAIATLLGHDPAGAREQRAAWQPVVVVRNEAARARGGVATVDVQTFLMDVPVGPGSAPTEEPAVAAADTPVLQDVGRLQVLSRATTYDRIESPRHYPDNDLVAATTALAWVPPIPGYGLRAFPVGEAADEGAQPNAPVVVVKRRMQNGLLSVEAADDGEVAVVHTASGWRLEPLILLEDEADGGDLYTPSLRPNGSRDDLLAVKRLHRGPLRGELRLDWRMRAPGHGRLQTVAELSTHIVLDADAPFVRVDVTGTNMAADHRLRIGFATGVRGASVWADAAFGPVQRVPIDVPAEEARTEKPPATQPLHRYVSLFDRSRGVTVFSDGLAEYEARQDGTVFVTLVRAVGELSKNDLPERPGHAGWPVAAPRAQSLGAFRASFAIMPHGSRTTATIDAIERAADDVLNPLVGTTLRSALRVPEPVAGVELEGPGLAFTALKESDDGQWTVTRCVNLLDEPSTGSWHFGFSVAEARRARLDETPLDAIDVVDNRVRFAAGPRGIVTILVR